MTRKILAGIDEAGLGPTLGPLATACAAIAAPGDWRYDEPWERLADAVCGEWRRGEARIAVADSKVIYKTGGLARLEATVAAFARLASGGLALDISDGDSCEIHPCYSRSLEPFPCFAGAGDCSGVADSLERVCEGAGVEVVHLGAALLFETVLNRRFIGGMNKSEALLVETGRHLAALVAGHQDVSIEAVIDKQGGRNDYRPFLAALFPGAWVDELAAGRERSSYRMRRAGGDVTIHFLAKGDRHSFATALASMTAKYMRERAMGELNAWFGERCPGLKATAGYPVDAKRWLDEARAAGAGESLALLVRER